MERFDCVLVFGSEYVGELIELMFSWKEPISPCVVNVASVIRVVMFLWLCSVAILVFAVVLKERES